MKPVNRRKFLQISGALASAAAIPDQALAKIEHPSFDDANAKLYDATKCIGCRACGRKCREENDLPPDEVQEDGVKWDKPQDLGPNNFMVLQLFKPKDGESSGGPADWSFIKKNCMHCNVPACVAACPVAALRKIDEGEEKGRVKYFEEYCIGCRYCMLACPYGVPRYEWNDRVPAVRKCTLCLECVKACPTGALKAGKRKDLIAEAHQRIQDNPDRYVPHVYGENEAGGASYLILSGIPHEKFDLPKLASAVRSNYAEPIMRGLPGWIIGLGLFLGGLHKMEQWQQRTAKADRKEDQS